MTDRDDAVLFLIETDAEDGKARLAALQQPGGDKVVLGIEIGDGAMTAKLTVEQAVALGVSLLARNGGTLAHFAERMPEELAAELGMALLAVPAKAALLRQAPAGGPEAN